MHNSITVLGAGMVGTCCALQLAERGYAVTLVDRQEPGYGTSYGNAGLINRGSVFPLGVNELVHHLFPAILKQTPHVHVHLRHLPAYWRWLVTLFKNSRTRASYQNTVISLNALFQHALEEHRRLLRKTNALDMLLEGGWLKLYRHEDAFQDSHRERTFYDQLAIQYDILNPSQINELEPTILPNYTKGIWLKETASLSNPCAVVNRYVDLLLSLGGKYLQADVQRLMPNNQKYTVETKQELLESDQIVLAMGPWSDSLLQPLGYHFPMAWERGYHQHYQPGDGCPLSRPVYDVEGGFVIAPMTQGLRLTTGIELTHRDALASPRQLQQAALAAQSCLPLGSPTGDVWHGSRPSMPDSLPVIGAAPKHPGLWFAFGHGHVGIGTAAVTGRLLAEQISNEEPLIDMTPFSPLRFL